MARRFERSAGMLRIREVGVRYIRVPSPSKAVTSPENAAQILFDTFETALQPQELLMALHLDSRNRCLGVEVVYRGSVSAATVSCRDVLRSALLLNAAGVIVGHQHPSGDPTPSVDDCRFSGKLAEAATLIGLELIDHVVIGFDDAGQMAFRSIKQMGVF